MNFSDHIHLQNAIPALINDKLKRDHAPTYPLFRSENDRVGSTSDVFKQNILSVDDAFEAYNWLVRSKNIPTSQIIVMGDSAGGGLSLLLAQRLRDQSKNQKTPWHSRRR